MQAELVRTMAAYNGWMNEKLYAVCAELTDEERKVNRNAFFKSIHGTLNHLLLADKVWLGRFTSAPFVPKSLDQELYSDFDELRAQRAIVDAEIVRWAERVTDEALAGPIEFRSITNPQPRKYTLWVCVAHFFNHQAHHRGQLTALLSQAGKDYGVTDLIAMPGMQNG
jgi:uncharacterized damage-inducible protein DinB